MGILCVEFFAFSPQVLYVFMALHKQLLGQATQCGPSALNGLNVNGTSNTLNTWSIGLSASLYARVLMQSK